MTRLREDADMGLEAGLLLDGGGPGVADEQGASKLTRIMDVRVQPVSMSMDNSCEASSG